MEIVKKSLHPNEKILEQFSQITYMGRKFNCTLTNFRILLSQKDILKDAPQKSIEIQYDAINNFSLEKEWYVDLIYLIPISFSLAFVFLFASLITYFPLNFTPANIDLLRACLYPGIIFAAIGIGAVIYYFKRVKFSIILTESMKTHEIFSKYAILLKLINIIQNVKSGKKNFQEPTPPLEFSKYQIPISKVIIGISTAFFIIIEWFYIYPNIRDMFYIPFLLLIIGFLIGVMGYNKKNLNPVQFKLGFFLLFIGMNVMWFFLYINTLPLSGLIIIIIGAILYIRC
ncbi:MAG: PH domain-containing protein [Candidatus Helarchaeota archaeon]